MDILELRTPALDLLPSYVQALQRDWSADNVRGIEAAKEELAAIDADAAGFVAWLTDREARGPAVTLPDGSKVPRLPGYRMWIWDGEFCGSIGMRWQPGTAQLPAHVLGHVGYAVVPWKQRRGYATWALGAMLPLARDEGLPWIELTTDADNVASQRVIERNAGTMVERFVKPVIYGSKESLRYRILL
jgi:predicted acetyltransferase